MITKKMNRFAMAFVAIAMASALLLALSIQTSAPAHAQAFTTNLTVASIVVDDQNYNQKKAFTQGDQA